MMLQMYQPSPWCEWKWYLLEHKWKYIFIFFKNKSSTISLIHLNLVLFFGLFMRHMGYMNFIISSQNRYSPTVRPLYALFFVLLQFYKPFYVKNKKNDNFICLLKFECAKRLKAHSRAIPDKDNDNLMVLSHYMNQSFHDLISISPNGAYLHAYSVKTFLIPTHIFISE